MNSATKLLLVLCCWVSLGVAHQRNYITGHGFKRFADYVIEQEQLSFRPERVKRGDSIFVKIDFVGYFFTKVFPQITQPIILITHNGDYSAPGHYAHYLEHPNLIRWFGQNCDIAEHPKFTPIPIGIANSEWEHGNPLQFDAVLDLLAQSEPYLRISKMYLNFSPQTNPIRKELYRFFADRGFVHYASVKPLMSYLYEMAKFRFVLSPFGNGLDCHRTWEALLVGAIPVVQRSTLDPLYTELGVIIVDSWAEVTLERLLNEAVKLEQKQLNKNKLFLDYWIQKIKEVQEAARAAQYSV